MEQDCAEFLNFLLDILENDIKQIKFNLNIQ